MKKNFIITLGLLPVVAVWFSLLTENIEWLGADPIKFITTYSGQITVYFLIATLLVSNLRFWVNLIAYRRALGVYVFIYGAIHFAIWGILDDGFNNLAADLVKRPFIAIGFAALVLLAPLAATSNQFAIRLLKRNWKKLHKLVYPISLLAILHVIVIKASKGNYNTFLYVAGTSLIVLLALRIPVVQQLVSKLGGRHDH
jgi:sulfoxide reductase heme-binding subunit YedZ